MSKSDLFGDNPQEDIEEILDKNGKKRKKGGRKKKVDEVDVPKIGSKIKKVNKENVNESKISNNPNDSKTNISLNDTKISNTEVIQDKPKKERKKVTKR